MVTLPEMTFRSVEVKPADAATGSNARLLIVAAAAVTVDPVKVDPLPVIVKTPAAEIVPATVWL